MNFSGTFFYYVVILGENKLKQGIVQLKDMKKGEQKEIPVDSVLSYFQN